MTIRKAIVDDQGNVINTISLPDDWKLGDAAFWQPDSGQTLVDIADGAEPGATYDAARKTFSPATPPAAPQTTDQRIAALEKSIQALVDNDVIAKDALPDEIKGRIEAKRAP